LVLFASWASILGEALTGKGTQAQFDIETGIPLNQAEPLLLFFILFTLLGANLPQLWEIVEDLLMLQQP